MWGRRKRRWRTEGGEEGRRKGWRRVKDREERKVGGGKGEEKG